MRNFGLTAVAAAAIVSAAFLLPTSAGALMRAPADQAIEQQNASHDYSAWHRRHHRRVVVIIHRRHHVYRHHHRRYFAYVHRCRYYC